MHIHPFKLERYFAKYEFKVPYMLCSSDGESFTLDELMELEPSAREAFGKLWLGHTHAEGNPELRQEISKLYSTLSPDQVLVHSGAEEAIFTVMSSLVKKGDHLIVHYPRYQSLSEVASAIGCEITFWKTNQKNDWELDIDFLRASIKKNTKLIVINCPHNPTGYLMSHEKLKEIIAIAREYDLYLFSDEVYRYLEFEEKDRLPAACDLYDKAISLGVMSKTFCLAGLRIGWIATKDLHAYQQAAAYKDYTTRCNSAPSEFLSALALRHADTIIERNLQIVKTNLTILHQFIADHKKIFHWCPPKAGSVAFPSLNIPVTADTFCRELVEKTGVLLMPGNCFSNEKNHFRIGFGHKDMPLCLDILTQYLKMWV
jgi:aspartate/methionine/tyrosine aminotransferase